MIKGSQAKDFITETLLQTFPKAFIDGKCIRVPMQEVDSKGLVSNVEIKITLTAAKDLIWNGDYNKESQLIIDFENAPTEEEIRELNEVNSSF